jgi:hypothetical protein
MLVSMSSFLECLEYGFEVLALQGTSEELVARQIFGRGNDAHFDISYSCVIQRCLSRRVDVYSCSSL